jgi:hypothetical protein
MSARQFDKYMVAIGASRHIKFRRLSIPERHAFFMGILSIAAQAPIRGCLLVGELNAEPEDVAAEADVPARIARSAMVKLRTVGVIVTDDEHGCEAVHDFADWNPVPKTDETNAERQRRYRARRNAKNGTVTNGAVTACNAGEVEGEVEVTAPLTPRGGTAVTADFVVGELPPARPSGNRKTDLARHAEQFASWSTAHFPGCDPKPLASLVEWVRSRGVDPTPAAVREFATNAPNFAHVLEPAA